MNQSFGLYFANLECYRYQDLIFVPGDISNNRLFILLPVYNDSEGRYQKPTDLIENPQEIMSRKSLSSESQILQQYEQQRQLYQQQRQQQQYQPQQPRKSSQHMQNEFQQSTWGQNQYTSSSSAVSEQWREHVPIRATSSSELSTMQNYSGYYSLSSQASPEVSTSSQDDFPSLPVKQAKKPSIQPPGKEMKRRVLRINNQKASNDIDQLNSYIDTLQLDPCFSQTLYDTKRALSAGLELARGFRGKVKFGAKLGHVLWSNVTTEIQKKIWPYTDIYSVLVKQRNVKPFFNYL